MTGRAVERGEGWRLVRYGGYELSLDEGMTKESGAKLCLTLAQHFDGNPFPLTIERMSACPDTPIAFIAEGLAAIESLVALELEAGVTDTDIVALLTAFNRHGSLLRLKLPQNNPSIVTWRLLCSTTLLSLDLQESKIGVPETQVICETLSENSSLLTLNLSLNAIGAQGVTPIAELLKRNRHIQDLGLYGCKLRADDGTHIFNALCENHTLLFLDIGGNNIGSSAEDIARCIVENNSLLYLNLDRINLDDSGAAGIGHSLIKNNSLLHINLSENEVGSQGTLALSEALLLNVSLVHLQLSGNHIGEDDCLSISQALTRNHTLLYLGLSRNPIGPVGAERILKSLDINKTILNINLFENGVENAIQNNARCKKQSEHKLYHFKFVCRNSSRFLVVFGDDFSTSQDYTITLQEVNLKTMRFGFHKIALVPPEFSYITERWQAKVGAFDDHLKTPAVNTTHYLRNKCVVLLAIGWSKPSCVLHVLPLDLIQLIAEFGWCFAFSQPLTHNGARKEGTT
ncbi:NOD3 protein [Pelomyxa schiedti]|nr:NOD3 protein [Pelomyxa schiedti]